ncbi:hypothetical protein [Flavobacterium tibetense]|jgi:hypothetical protein|uniref:Uncharacterized protein n=1 Tax=Flavobacterium tibetense TaxID=2233533 RepID=A0A365P2B1_9FLAO|nr:hypothetical protein [Flavobacterium tibetense]RBA28667.1 hypothetical protein DPN68_06550 [Flavobacterium tibetense]
MKNFILFAAFFISYVSFGQIKVIETIPTIRIGVIGQNDIYIQKKADEYTFFYKNVKQEEAPTLKSFTFKEIDNAFENLHKIIESGFTAEPLLDIKLELPNDFVWIHYSKNFGEVYMQFVTTKKDVFDNGFSKSLNLDQVNKLFGKSSVRVN